MPSITLHVLPPSHPCMTVEAALKRKGLEYEKVALQMPHTEEMERIYGPGNSTVPGMLVDGEPVHHSVAILERLAARGRAGAPLGGYPRAARADRARPFALPRADRRSRARGRALGRHGAAG